MKFSPPALLRSWLLVLGCIALGSSLEAAEPPEFQLSESDGEAWVKQIETAIGRQHCKNWSVTLKGNDITLGRNEPAAMMIVPPNQPLGAEPVTVPDGEKTLRYVLRFGPKLSLADYERLAAINNESNREEARLRRATGVAYKFDRFAAVTPEQKERVRQFEAEVAKLPRHNLPNLYSTDHGIILLQSGGVFSVPVDAAVADELHDIRQRLFRLFGIYDPAVAAGYHSLGGYIGDREH